jgi:hypothetical protein
MLKVGKATVGGNISGSGVNVGNGVGLGTSVGGKGVAVGIAAFVAATIVCAAATAVFCISAGLTGRGVGAVLPQAVKKTAEASRIGKIRFNIV